jgi:hypothetical protein
MKKYSKTIKSNLNSIIKEMEKEPEPFVRCPGTDFTRKRKLSFSELTNILLTMGGNTIAKELLEHLDYSKKKISASAFVQQRKKILPYAFEYLFNKFTQSYNEFKLTKGFRILAIDGSSLNTPRNKDCTSTHFRSRDTVKGYNLTHLNAMYDIGSHLYVDAILQPGRKVNECSAMVDMIDRSNIEEPVLVIADRGYESYNIFAHAAEKGWKYLIRVKDVNSNGIASTLGLPTSDAFDTTVTLDLTYEKGEKIRSELKNHRSLNSNVKFDFVGDKNSGTHYSLSFRVLRFKISMTQYETIITNLDGPGFSVDVIKEFYYMRWGIETSFRTLKYSIGLINFHSKDLSCITQEVFAKLTMYNFCEMITLHVVILQKNRKHDYKANFTMAIYCCRHYLSRKSDARPPAIEALIQRYILPIRKGQANPRKVRSRQSISFIYRVA